MAVQDAGRGFACFVADKKVIFGYNFEATLKVN